MLLALTRQYEKVRALKRQTSHTDQVRKVFSWYCDDAEAEVLFRKIEWVVGDISDIFSLESCLEGVDLVYHCAAVVSFEGRRRKEMLHNNVEGTANLVNAALSAGVKWICHVSSNSALGKSKDGSPVTEETSWTPSRNNSGYSESKFFSEAEIWRGVEEGIEAVVVNPSIIIGPGHWGSGSTSFFPVIDGGLKFYPRGTTGFVDVRDVVDAILLLTDTNHFEEARNRKFLLSGQNLTYRDFFSQVAAALGKPAPSVVTTCLMLGIAWRMASLWALLTGKPPRITRETVTNSNSAIYFDGSLITKMFGFHYRDISEAIRHTASCYLNDKDKA